MRMKIAFKESEVNVEGRRYRKKGNREERERERVKAANLMMQEKYIVQFHSYPLRQ